MLIRTKQYRDEASSTNRRRILRGLAGIAVTLPAFMSLRPKETFAATIAAPKRLVVMWWPDGVKEGVRKPSSGSVLLTSSGGAGWFPSGSETSWTPVNLAAPLAKVQQDIIMFQGIDHVNWPAVGCPHDVGPHFSLTSLGDTSIDQAIGKRMTTRFKSVELGVGTWEIERQDTRISYLNGKALPPQCDPNVAFRKFFSDPTDPTANTAAALEKLAAKRKSVLDGVLEEIQRVGGKLGKDDRSRLDYYTSSVRDFEHSITNLNSNMAAALAAQCTNPKLDLKSLPRVVGGEATGGHTPLFDKIAEVQMNIAILALQCDLTRVVTIMFEKGRSDQKYRDFLNIKPSSGTHEFAHSWIESGDMEAGKEAVDKWRAETFATMVQKLKSAPDVDGQNLLYNSLLVKTSEIATGSHSYTDIPIVLAGSAGGAIRTGRFLNYTSTRQRSASLWLGVAKALDVPMTSFPEDGKMNFGSNALLPNMLA